MYAYSQAAVRFAEGCPAGRAPSPKDDIDYHGARFTCLLVEGETNVNTIVARASTRGWRVRRGAASSAADPKTGDSPALSIRTSWRPSPPAAQRMRSIPATATSN